MNSPSRVIASILTTCVLLAAMLVRADSLAAPEQIDRYHGAVAEAVERVPYRWNGWVGRDIPTPPAAQRLLRPNALLSRAYTHTETGAQCHVLVVHCRDTRDMLGHFPPVCYPAHGWLDRTSSIAPPDDPRLRIYRFERRGRDDTEAIIVRNFFVLPGAGRAPDMDTLRSSDELRSRRVLGAAQIQMVFDTALSPEDRAKTADSFESLLSPVIQRVQDWPTP